LERGLSGDRAAGGTARSPSAMLAVAEAMSHYRKGQGIQAQSALKNPGAIELFTQYERMIPGGLARFMEDCKLYRGQGKPTLSPGEVGRMLQFEVALLSGADRSWSSELLLNGGQPLIEVDPARLAESLNVDATRPLFRRGRWVEQERTGS
jgi:hypothetical protein